MEPRAKRILLFIFLFIVVYLSLLSYFVHRHELAHAHIAEYFGYHPGEVFVHDGAVSLSTGVPVSDLNTPKYWAYLAAQSSVDASGYQLLAVLPVLSATLAGVLVFIIGS